MNGKLTLYIDQYGLTYKVKSLKELKKLIAGKVSKMRIDKKDGTCYQVGYVISNRWLKAYTPVEIKQ